MSLTHNLIGEYVSPDKVPGLYETRQMRGAMKDLPGFQSLLADLQTPVFGIAAPHLYNTGAGKLSTPYKQAVALDQGFGSTEAQTTGDCVSHATRNAATLDYSVDVLAGRTEYIGRLATENIYGARGHGGQGASCSTLARYVWANGKGGLLVRKKHGEGRNSVDLSVYNSRTGHNWGRSGTPSWLNKIAAEHPVETVSNVRSIEEARDALANGYGISVCSGYGFSSKRDSNGVSQKKGGWGHAMAWIACDDTDWAHKNYGGMLFLIQNSWGRWNGGPKRHDQPDGSFWITEKVARAMLRNGGAWVVSGVEGFRRRHLSNMLI
jgi:hypothetical protein